MSGGYRERAHTEEAVGGQSVRIRLPMPIKTLVPDPVSNSSTETSAGARNRMYLNVAPDPTMYLPNVRMTPA